MTALAMIQTPLLSVSRGPLGVWLGQAEAKINGAPLSVTLTEAELHIGFADRDGPSFVLDLNTLCKAAINEIEAQLGLPQRYGTR